MQRNLRNEIIIAVAALMILILGLIFAALITNFSAQSPLTSATRGVTIVANVTRTIATEQQTTELAITATTTEPTVTPSPTSTMTATAVTPDTATATVTRKPSRTPAATATQDETATPTVTSQPTETDEPTSTPSPDNAPTHTSQPTETDEPTSTPSPDDTPQRTAVVVGIGGVTTIIPTPPASPTVRPPDEPTRTPTNCLRPRGWASYRVQSGDTLFAIALATRSTLEELRVVNCIADVDNITTGDEIFVPRLPVTPVTTRHPDQPRQGLARIGCADPRTRITNLVPGQRVSGLFPVIGTATREDFWYYKIEIRPDFASVYNFYSDAQNPIENGLLGQVNVDIFGAGLHWVRLSVVDLGADIPPGAICEIPVIFE